MLPILYRDELLIAVNKPAGLLVHRSEIDRHETRFAIQMVRNQIGLHVFPLHRLDKPTSGVLLFALSSDVARRMMDQFVNNTVQKRYLAVVRGYTAEAAVIDHPLKEELDRMTDSQAQQDKAAQPAITDYHRLATAELPYAVGRYATARYSLLRVTPRSGRKHQIRRHMKHIFHPIVGDTTHGDGRQNEFFRDHFNCHRLLLAATELELVHPITHQPLLIQAPLDAEYQQIIDALGWGAGR
jgi:tRNA pseudouridine65 synthase